ncbi:hypothetical protein SAMN04489730_3832 [Amycolatopsis australiensis]|uniref:CsbD-like n=1 Tax=Amycolatopsis australiensis TaxID=546364 RepID=A0A1K1RSE3_9PSEU|nr:hypothetical protein SAMN04489730_3832 [Amycolatopsis australiensis]
MLTGQPSRRAEQGASNLKQAGEKVKDAAKKVLGG